MIKNILCVLVLLISIISCKKNNENVSKNTMFINYHATTQSVHPYRTCDVRTWTISKSLYEGLTRLTREGEVEWAAAEKIEISPDGKTYTFTLRDSKWSNGEKLTSHHFVESWKKVLQKKVPCNYIRRFFLIKNAKDLYNGKTSLDQLGVKTSSDKKIVIELEHPAPYFLKLVADPVYSPIYDLDQDREPTVFNGPFVIKSFEVDKQITLSANPLYWDAKIVKIKEIKISFIKDAQTSFSVYEEGKLDFIGSPFSNLSDETIETFSSVKYEQASAPFWVCLNTENPKLASVNIRKALSYAINRKEMMSRILFKQREILQTILPKDISSLDFNPLPENGDEEKAIEFFEKGLKEIGLKRKDFQLTINHSSARMQENIAIYLKNCWEKIFKINVTLVKGDWNSFFSKIVSGNYEVGGYFNSNLYDDPSYLMEYFEYSHNNYSRWENADYQKYFSLAKQSLNEEQRRHYLQEAEKILVDEMPVIPIYNHAHLYMCSDRLVNFSAPVFNYADFKWAYLKEGS